MHVCRSAIGLAVAGLLTLLLPARAQIVPTIVATVPANFTLGVAPSAPVVITFSTAMNTNVTSAQFTDSANPGAPLPVVKSWNAARTQLTCTPNPAFPASAMISWTAIGMDLLGNPLGGNPSGMFMTGTGGPYVVSTTPENGATNVPPGTPVVFTFSFAMNTNETSALFHSLANPTTFLPFTSSWSVDKTRLTCTPTPSFPVGQAIQWSVYGEDLNTNSLQPSSGMFMTTNSGGTAPALLSVVPANQATNIAITTPVQFTFSTSMDTTATVARFNEVSDPFQTLAMTPSWSKTNTVLTCAPNPSWPAGGVIIWNLQGQDAATNILPAAGGSFSTAGTSGGPTNFPHSALVSRGAVAAQVDTNAFELAGHELVVLCDPIASSDVRLATPLPATNVLATHDAVPALEFMDQAWDDATFATNYAAGAYRLLVRSTSGVANATVNLADGLFPAAPRLLNWQNPPHVVLAQPLVVQWTWEAGGASVDYVRVRIEHDGQVVFASPLPDAAGALTAASNSIVVPGSVFTNAGVADVSIAAYTFTALETNAIPGLKLRAARHRTTAFELRVVDGASPSPRLLTTNLPTVAIGDPVLYPLRATNGVRPLKFTQIGGSLPPGLALGSDGSLEGQANTAGAFDATVRTTDLLGQSTTQSLRIVTTNMPLFAMPKIENARFANGSLRFEMVNGTDADCQVERSTNLLNWTAYAATNAPTNRLSMQAPVTGPQAYFRARGPGALPTTPRPLTVAPVLNTNVTITSEVNFFGGTLRLTNAAGCVFTLNVPPGALNRSETITMTEVAGISGLPLSGGLRGAVELQPAGLAFLESVRLDITPPIALNTNRLVGFTALGDGRWFSLHPSFTTNQTVSLHLWYGMVAGIGEATLPDVQAQLQHIPDDPGFALGQRIEATRLACALGNCDAVGQPSGLVKSARHKAGDPVSDPKLQQYITYADTVVIPKLRNAAQYPGDAVIDDAWTTWLTWARELELWGYSTDMTGAGQQAELASRLSRALGLAGKMLIGGINKACTECMNHDIGRMERVVDLAYRGALIGFSYENKIYECLRKCMKFEFKLDSEITVQGPDGTLITHTKSEFKLRPRTEGWEDVWAVHKYVPLTGDGTWEITNTQEIETKCPITSSLSSGTARLPVVNLDFFADRAVAVPGQGMTTTKELSPHLTVYLRVDLKLLPKEGRIARCPEDPPTDVADLYGPGFTLMHYEEVVTPEADSLEAQELGGPCLKITSFQAVGSSTLFSKEFNWSQAAGKATVTEVTTIDFLHKP